MKRPAKFVKWPKIGKYSDAAHNARKHMEPGEITYQAKVKLHGTNAGIHFGEDGKHRTQSRNRLLNKERDNAGFDAWVQETGDDIFAPDLWVEGMVLFGEWCGPDIQSKVAACDAPHKFFAAFAILEIDGSLTVEPKVIESMLIKGRPDLFAIPWLEKTRMDLNFFDMTEEQSAFTSSAFDLLIQEVEAQDPLMRDRFLLDGIGEGVVFYPFGIQHGSMEGFGEFAFKLKGEKHTKSGKRYNTNIDPVKLSAVQEFADFAITQERLDQGISELGLEERKSDKTGQFVKWVIDDAIVECKVELEASGLLEKDVKKAIGHMASSFYRSAM